MVCGSQYVLPARKMQSRMIPHIPTITHTLTQVALAKSKGAGFTT